jgi:predicted metal-binding membrane protein
MASSPASISAKAASCADRMTDTTFETLFRRESLVVLAALVALTLLAWVALLLGAGTGMDPLAMSGWPMPLELPVATSGAWGASYWLVAFLMWAAMMVAMMLPSASPMVLLYARVVRQAETRGHAGVSNAAASIAAFAAAYLASWILFSLLAVVLQFGLERAGAMSAMMSARIAPLSGALLVAAGLYQLTPLKAACLRHCRSPAQFIAAHWRPGVSGAWRMGLAHGLYCLGCCAVLMLLLFVGGIMNLVWIAGLTLFVALEKLAPFGERAGKAMAALLVAGGTLLMLS